MLDTCVFVHAERSNTDFKQFAEDADLFISSITVSELLVGAHSANTDARRVKRSAFVEAIITKIPVLDFTAETARVHAELYAILSQQGRLIGPHDLIIAATALAHGHSVVTANHHEFNRVPGLKVFTI